MQKKKLWNALMVVAASLIMISGLMLTANLRGWFTAQEASGSKAGEAAVQIEAQAVVTKKIGNANIERGGIAYALTENTVLKNGDIIETLNGSLIECSLGDNKLSLNENSEAVVAFDNNGTQVTLSRGEAFLYAKKAFSLCIANKEITGETAVLSLSAQSGSAGIYVLGGEANIDGENFVQGKALSLLQDGLHANKLSAKALNEFTIENAQTAAKDFVLCFTAEELKNVVEERQAEIAKALQEKIKAQEAEKAAEEKLAAAREKNKKKIGAAVSAPGGNTNGSASTPILPPETTQNTCTIEIRCDTILNNMADLTDGKNQYVPQSGIILAASTLPFAEGETVFDVLKKACELAGLQLEYSWTPMYNSYYIEGINHLYEFDCGNESGWMYKVNGWFPNYGCSAYPLKNGDVIVWTYTCKGLGADVGGSVG